MPIHPGVLSIPRHADAADAPVRRREAHHERIRKYREALDVKKALVRQSVASVDSVYLDDVEYQIS